MAICWLACNWPDQTLTTHLLATPGPMGRDFRPGRRKGVDHPAQAGQAGGEDHIMERNLDNPLISLRGLAADHCMSRLLRQQHSFVVDQDWNNEEMVLHTMFCSRGRPRQRELFIC